MSVVHLTQHGGTLVSEESDYSLSREASFWVVRDSRNNGHAVVWATCFTPAAVAYASLVDLRQAMELATAPTIPPPPAPADPEQDEHLAWCREAAISDMEEQGIEADMAEWGRDYHADLMPRGWDSTGE